MPDEQDSHEDTKAPPSSETDTTSAEAAQDTAQGNTGELIDDTEQTSGHLPLATGGDTSSQCPSGHYQSEGDIRIDVFKELHEIRKKWSKEGLHDSSALPRQGSKER